MHVAPMEVVATRRQWRSCKEARSRRGYGSLVLYLTTVMPLQLYEDIIWAL